MRSGRSLLTIFTTKVSLQYLSLLERASMVTVPRARGVTRPEELTVAILRSDVYQRTCWLASAGNT